MTSLRLGTALPIGGGVLALLLAAGFFVALPDWRLEQLVEASGLSQLVSMAAPPLGNTARLLLAMGAGVIAGAVTWSALFLLFGPGGTFHREPGRREAPPRRDTPSRPVVRRADAHPDAPPRHPMTAAELGTPPPAHYPPAEQGLPADLDQPLAAFDPTAIPDVPRAPVRPVAPIAPPPPPPPPAPAVVAPPPPRQDAAAARNPAPGPAPDPESDPVPSIATLLDRLERGTRHHRGG